MYRINLMILRLSALLFMIFSSLSLLSQSIIFPNIGDGCQSGYAKYGYFDGIPIEIKADSIVKLFADHGSLEIVKDQFYNYRAFPKKNGALTVTLISYLNGIRDTTSAEIKVVHRPALKLVVHRKGDLMKLNFLNAEGDLVTDDFNCSMEIEILGGESENNIIIGEWKGWMPISSFFLKDDVLKIEGLSMIISTTAVYSREFDLFTGNYMCSMRIN